MFVLFFHLGGILALKKYFGVQLFGGWFSFGDAAVKFFFVLSGFIIFHVHRKDIGQPKRFPQYALKRALRIYPTYWLIFLSAILLACTSASTRDLVPHSPVILLKSLFLFPQDPAVVGGTGAPVLMVAWTLQYEMVFYASFGLAILNRWIGIAGMAIIIGIFFLTPGTAPFPLSFFHKQEMLLFWIGIITAYLCSMGPGRAVATACLLIGLAGFAGLAVVQVVIHPAPLWLPIFFGIASGLIILGLVGLENVGCTLGAHPFFQLLGAESYALYLVHAPLISIFAKLCVAMKLSGVPGAIIAGTLITAACIGIALLIQRFFEAPILRSGQRVLVPRRAEPTPV